MHAVCQIRTYSAKALEFKAEEVETLHPKPSGLRPESPWTPAAGRRARTSEHRTGRFLKELGQRRNLLPVHRCCPDAFDDSTL